ncbi:hypothetical protein M3M40_00520 [Fructilactobacillus cliffordii]|uniref:Uncharacterized protein n=1 Tax=Fructilactobacillus cliffordii TaxID=2940299 RepID=A0A9Q8ZTH1_9LACO|nr:hypothetical protein [Fructilactobacillus cliffordii]USS86256.1 hypothetical protein M3M38_06095 [Fructilactobacillus cliffordii]USS89324.1 hypothetical protein M3M40_00520 [Fructilactobacillus cliffordii]
MHVIFLVLRRLLLWFVSDRSRHPHRARNIISNGAISLSVVPTTVTMVGTTARSQFHLPTGSLSHLPPAAPVVFINLGGNRWVVLLA